MTRANPSGSTTNIDTKQTASPAPLPIAVTDGGVDDSPGHPIDDPRDGPTLESHELFTLLGNPTRIQILKALWADFSFERYVTSSQEAMSFSKLRTTANISDSGNYNYHLDKLTGELVADREDGYVLTPLGYNLMRAITTYEAFEYQTIPATDLDYDCPFCEHPLTAEYTQELVATYCQHCAGLAHGDISTIHLPVNEIASTNIERVLDAAALRLQHRIEAVSYGHCWRCHSDLDPTITICDDHALDDTGTCERCSSRFQAAIAVECDHCGTAGTGPLVEVAIVEPQAAAFFAEYQSAPRDVGPFRYRLTGLAAVAETIPKPSTPVVTYAFTTDDDSVTMDLECGGESINVRRH